MGLIISWFKKPSTKELLADIQEELDNIEDKRRDVELRMRRIGRYVVYSFVTYLIVGVCTYWYWLPDTLNDWLVFSMPFAAFPPLVMAVKRVINWYYARQLRNSRGQVEKLKKKKKDILDQVMETETYKVAKEILQEYAPEQLSPFKSGVVIATPTSKAGAPASVVRQRATPSVRPLAPATPVRPGLASTPSSRPGVIPQPRAPFLTPRALAGTPQLARTPGMLRPSLQSPLKPPLTGAGPPGPPMPRPAVARERGIMDRLIDYMMKEGPNNSYALVCRQCETHNGMALKDEFPYMAYRCAFCHYWNPARKQRPAPPKLENLEQNPPPPPVVESESSSGTEEEEEEEEDIKGGEEGKPEAKREEPSQNEIKKENEEEQPKSEAKAAETSTTSNDT